MISTAFWKPVLASLKFYSLQHVVESFTGSEAHTCLAALLASNKWFILELTIEFRFSDAKLEKILTWFY